MRKTRCGQSSHTISLVQDVDDKAARAKLEDGVLHLTLPKRAGAQSRLIAIH